MDTKEKIAKEIFDYIVALNIDGEEPDIRDIRAIIGKFTAPQNPSASTGRIKA